MNGAVDRFNSTMLQYFELTIPKEVPKRNFGPNWFNNTLRRLRNLKSKKYKKYKNSGMSVDYANYIHLRNRYQRLCKINYDKYLFTLSSSFKNNPRSFWDFVKTKRKSREATSCLSYEGRVSDSDFGSCELFADFFKSVYSKTNFSNDYYPYDIKVMTYVHLL